MSELRLMLLPRLPVLLVLVVLHAGVLGLMQVIGIYSLPAESQTVSSLAWHTLRLMVTELWLLVDVLAFVVWAAGASLVQLRRQLLEQRDGVFVLERRLADSRLQSLKMQLNPHFLFNTLNGLAVLIDKQENVRARDMLDELSRFLRQTLRSHNHKWTSLEQEIEFIRQYLRIEQYRFGERLTWFEDCEPLALAAKVPPMLLQPLFENAIVHGLADKQGECRLGFECRLYDRYLVILIFDNGDKLDTHDDPLDNAGIGLSNVQARLREVYGEHYSLKIEKKTDGTLVTLKLPAYKDSQF